MEPHVHCGLLPNFTPRSIVPYHWPHSLSRPNFSSHEGTYYNPPVGKLNNNPKQHVMGDLSLFTKINEEITDHTRQIHQTTRKGLSTYLSSVLCFHVCNNYDKSSTLMEMTSTIAKYTFKHYSLVLPIVSTGTNTFTAVMKTAVIPNKN